jgi:hypothetical protein
MATVLIMAEMEYPVREPVCHYKTRSLAVTHMLDCSYPQLSSNRTPVRRCQPASQ